MKKGYIVASIDAERIPASPATSYAGFILPIQSLGRLDYIHGDKEELLSGRRVVIRGKWKNFEWVAPTPKLPIEVRYNTKGVREIDTVPGLYNRIESDDFKVKSMPVQEGLLIFCGMTKSGNTKVRFVPNKAKLRVTKTLLIGEGLKWETFRKSEAKFKAAKLTRSGWELVLQEDSWNNVIQWIKENPNHPKDWVKGFSKDNPLPDPSAGYYHLAEDRTELFFTESKEEYVEYLKTLKEFKGKFRNTNNFSGYGDTPYLEDVEWSINSFLGYGQLEKE